MAKVFEAHENLKALLAELQEAERLANNAVLLAAYDLDASAKCQAASMVKANAAIDTYITWEHKYHD